MARSLACGESCGAVCGAEAQSSLGIPRDPRRSSESPRSRVRRSKPDAISRMLALGVVKSHGGVPFSGGISPNASVMRDGLGDAGPEGVEVVDYH